MSHNPKAALESLAALPITTSASPMGGAPADRDRAMRRAAARMAVAGNATRGGAELAETADGTLLRTGERRYGAAVEAQLKAKFLTTRGAAELSTKRKKGSGQP